MMNRRLILSHASAMAALGGIPELWRRSAAAAEPGPDAPTLVVIELTGGNDGLNMVVPYRDDAYHRARPTLRIKPEKVLNLDDGLGLHPAMTGLHRLWGQGTLRVLMNVGYPKPSRSHSRSMEIWQSGALEPTPTDGWIGRASDRAPALSPACFIGADATPLAVCGRDVAPFALGGIEAMRLRRGARLLPPPEDPSSPPAERVAQAMEAARIISGKVAAIRPSASSSEKDSLETRLATIRTLMESGLESRVYYTALDGFDTHAGQQYAHQELLRTLSAALSGFQSDLEASKLDDRVLVLVFSEFGRRTAENGSKGTDHGAAAPVLLLGSPVAGGLLGGPPDLANPDGDITFTLDFRDLYATVLADWLRVDPALVIGRRKVEQVKILEG